jgi:hypothetical protein
MRKARTLFLAGLAGVLLALVFLLPFVEAQVQVFDNPLKPPLDIFDNCDDPVKALEVGFCVLDGDTIRVLLDLGEGE